MSQGHGQKPPKQTYVVGRNFKHGKCSESFQTCTIDLVFKLFLFYFKKLCCREVEKQSKVIPGHISGWNEGVKILLNTCTNIKENVGMKYVAKFREACS